MLYRMAVMLPGDSAQGQGHAMPICSFSLK